MATRTGILVSRGLTLHSRISRDGRWRKETGLVKLPIAEDFLLRSWARQWRIVSLMHRELTPSVRRSVFAINSTVSRGYYRQREGASTRTTLSSFLSTPRSPAERIRP